MTDLRLSRIEYSELEGTDSYWALKDFKPGSITLIVGKNAAGKTRTLNLISGLAKVLGSGALFDGHLFAEFNEGLTRYELRSLSDLVLQEKLIVDGKTLLERDERGEGFVFSEAENKSLRFGLEATQLAVSAKRDRIQHPFLEPLIQWGSNARIYRFGSTMGHQTVAIIRNVESEMVRLPDPRDPDNVVLLFAHDTKSHPELVDLVRQDMNTIGYEIDRIFLKEIPESSLERRLRGRVHSLAVKERSIKCDTLQLQMSQGMFRALSLLYLMRRATILKDTSLILLDDIGEGLDFERATSLITLLVQLAREAGVQLIMSTNDRYVMNSVPLDAWAVLIREGSECRLLTKANSPEIFTEFEATGLANFDFLRMEFWKSATTTESQP